ncbi:MAG: histidine phosphatase family protein [Cyanobacteria bacterium P01_D01_bin.36]
MVAVSDISIASISAVSSRKRSSHTGAATTTKRGTAYFIRHGESTFNERNIFAGVVDAELTAFGKMQARQAGQDIQKKSVTFDAVYVSHLRRARQTCDISLAVSGALNSSDIEPQIDHRLGEKSFGIFAKRNKNLLRLALGYDGFEEFLHSHHETPPSGESISQVYDRVAEFYEEQVVPRLERGENVLVVCHQYVLEPLALYLSGLPVTRYQHLKLPNGKALSGDELVAFQHKESGSVASLRKKVNDLAVMRGVWLNAIAFFIGIFLKCTVLPDSLNSTVFTAIIVVCLAVSTFYSYLDIDFKASRHKISSMVSTVVNGWMVLRWVIGGLLLLSGWAYQGPEDLYKVLWILLWMVPPALTAPVLSILWGGNLYPSAVLSRTLSIFISAALIGLLSIVMLPISPASLGFFYVILILGLAVPGIIAQVWRWRSPVDSNHHSKNWKFIGIFSGVLMAFAAGFQFTPSQIISDVFFGTNAEGAIACLQQLGIALLSLSLMRVFAAGTVLFSKSWSNKAETQDAYILLVTPNFFLWAALFSGISLTVNQPVLDYALFWGAVGFFTIPLIEQIAFMGSFTRNMLRESMRSSRVGASEAQQLFQNLDVDDNKYLDKHELMALLPLIEDKTTGQRNAEDIRPYLANRLFETLDTDRSGSVDVHEFENYLSRNGLVVNLNVA